MAEFADKSQDKRQSIATSNNQQNNSAQTPTHFTDNRPEAVTQRKLQSIISNSSNNIVQLKSETVQRAANIPLEGYMQQAEDVIKHEITAYAHGQPCRSLGELFEHVNAKYRTPVKTEYDRLTGKTYVVSEKPVEKIRKLKEFLDSTTEDKLRQRREEALQKQAQARQSAERIEQMKTDMAAGKHS